MPEQSIMHKVFVLQSILVLQCLVHTYLASPCYLLAIIPLLKQDPTKPTIILQSDLISTTFLYNALIHFYQGIQAFFFLKHQV